MKDVRAALRRAIAGIERSFNSIGNMQARTRIALALSLLDRGASTRYARATSDLADFLSELGIDDRHYWISTFYTLLIEASVRREKATYFTPPAIVDHLIKAAQRAGLDLTKARIIDPAAGGAAFVSSIAGRMAELGCPTRDIRTRLTGIEIDEHLALLGDALVADRLGEPFDVEADRHILRVGDALQLGSNPIRYDAVFVNPPYGRILSSSSEYVPEWDAVSSPGHVNRYALFIDLAMRLAKPGGLVAVVSPSSFIAGSLFGKLRESIRSRTDVLRIDALERQDVFHDVQQDACVSLFRIKEGRSNGSFAPSYGKLDRNWRFTANGIVTAATSAPTSPWTLPDREGDDQGAMDLCSSRLSDYGVSPRAGYFVWNREEHRLRRGCKTRGAYPLFWAKNVRPGKPCHPASKTHSGIDFVTFEEQTSAIVRTASIILQRTTNSKQSKRLVAGVIPQKVAKKYRGYVSENHTILLVPKGGRPALRLLCRLLNSAAVDRRYRRIGGSSSVSVGSLNSLPLPDPKCLQSAMSRVGDFEEAVELAYGLSAALAKRSKAAAA